MGTRLPNWVAYWVRCFKIRDVARKEVRQVKDSFDSPNGQTQSCNACEAEAHPSWPVNEMEAKQRHTCIMLPDEKQHQQDRLWLAELEDYLL